MSTGKTEDIADKLTEAADRLRKILKPTRTAQPVPDVSELFGGISKGQFDRFVAWVKKGFQSSNTEFRKLREENQRLSARVKTIELILQGKGGNDG